MCDVDDCRRKASTHGWCQMHYRRWQRNGDPTVRIRMKQDSVCVVDGCSSSPRAHGMCVKHLRRFQRHGNVDTVAKGGRKVPPKVPRDLSFVCVACGSEFEREAKPGRPPVVCSAKCRVEAKRLQAKAWYEANPERAAAYRAATRERAREYNAAYYEQNREQEIQRSIAYARGRGRDAKRARDAARFALTRGAPTAERFTLDEIFLRDGGWCYLCEQSVSRRDATMDHVIPVTKGGPHTRANVRLAHRGCNTRKGNRPLAA